MSHKPLGIYINKSTSRSGLSMAKMHSHKSHEIYFLLAGQRRYFVGHRVYELVPGNLAFIPGDMLHRTTASGRKGYERYVVNFSERHLHRFIDLIGRSNFDRLLHSGCVDLPADISRQVRQDLVLLEQELKNRTAYTSAVAIHLLEDILLCALQHGKPTAPCTGETADNIQRVARYISENYAEPLTLQSAAQMANMEKTYFSKRFKLLTGFGFHEYLTQTRLLAAAQMLKETDLSMVTIAERCGFSGSNYFGDSFRRWMGISPSQYRKSKKNTAN